MSLNWDYTDKEKFAAIKGDPMNDVFIWGCMFTDMQGITEKNAEEWWVRYRMYDLLCGPFYYEPSENKERKPLTVTLADVKKRVGLRTNVTQKTRSAFLTKAYTAYAKRLAEDSPEKKTITLEVS